MPTPSRVGTPSQVDCSAASGSTSVTVPTGCNLVVAFWSHWHGNSLSTLSALTLGGANMLPALAELAEGAAVNETGVGVAILVNPPTGAQTLAWAWSDSAPRTEGGVVFLVYYQDANTSDPYRAVAVDAQTGTTQPAATVNSTASDDRVVGFTENSNPSTNPTPTITGVTAFVNDATINTHVCDVGDATGLTGSVTVSNSTPDYAAAAAISLKASAGAPPQLLRPSSDVSTGPWTPTPSSPATLADKIDEATPDDADYISTQANGTAKVALTQGSTPDAGAQTFRIRARGSPAKKLIARLLEGAATRATITVDPLTPTVTQYTATASGITDYSALAVEFEAADATTPPSAAVNFGAAGAFAYSAAAGATSIAPAYPTGITAGQKLILIVGMKPSTANSGSVTTPAGWTLIGGLTGAGGYGTTLGADTGNTNIWAFERDADGTETGNLTVTVATSNVAWGRIMRFTNGYAAWAATTFATGSDTTGDATVSVAGGSNPGFAANDMAVWAMCIPTDVTTPSQFSAHAITATGATFGAATEVGEADSTIGNDIGGFISYASVTAGSSTGNPTFTATAGGTVTNVRGPGIILRLRSAAPTEFARVTWSEFEIPAAASGGGAMVGTASLAFTPSGAMAGTGALAGSSTLTFTPASALTGTGAIAGSSAITFTPSATAQAIAAASGTAAMSFSPAGSMVGDGALAGTSALSFAPIGALTGIGDIAAQSQLVFTPSGTLTAANQGDISGAAAMAFAATGALTGDGALAGSAQMTITATAQVPESESTTEERPAGGWWYLPRGYDPPSAEEVRRQREKFGVIPKAARKAVRKVIERLADEAAAVETPADAREFVRSLQRQAIEADLREQLRKDRARFDAAYLAIVRALVMDEIRKMLERKKESERIEAEEAQEILGLWLNMF